MTTFRTFRAREAGFKLVFLKSNSYLKDILQFCLSLEKFSKNDFLKSKDMTIKKKHSYISKFERKWDTIEKGLKIVRKYDPKSKSFKPRPKDP